MVKIPQNHGGILKT